MEIVPILLLKSPQLSGSSGSSVGGSGSSSSNWW